jgi:hypothetical protein
VGYKRNNDLPIESTIISSFRNAYKVQILTYRYFTTPQELLDEIIKRYKFEPPRGAAVEVSMYYNKWRGPIQLRY